MAACFEKLGKINPIILRQNLEWKNCFTAKDIDKYIIPSNPNKPHGKGANALTERIDLNQNIYEPAARMTAFRVESKERLINWIHCLVFRYHIELGEKDEFLVEWTDKLCKQNESKHDEIQIKILTNDDSSQKIITIHIFLTTFLITVQGSFYKEWVSSEFEYLKAIVESSTLSTSQTKKDMDETVVKKNVTTHQTHRPSTCDKTVTVVKKRSDSQQTPCPPNSDHSSSEWNEIS